MYKILYIILLVVFVNSGYSQDLPLGYIQYFNLQTGKGISEQFQLSESAIIKEVKGGFVLSNKSDLDTSILVSDPEHSIDSIESDTNSNDSIIISTLFFDENAILSSLEIPKAKLLVDNIVFGDFISHLEVKITGDDLDSLSGTYFITGFRDEDNFYFIHFGLNGTGLYSRYKGKVKRVAFDEALKLTKNKWHTVIIKRDILKRSIIIQSDDKQISFSDPNLIMGQVGIGVSDNILTFRKLIVSAPTAIVEDAED